jgi:hypothetical protein
MTESEFYVLAKVLRPSQNSIVLDKLNCTIEN